MSLSKIKYPTIRQIFPSLVAQQITGIQPLTSFPMPGKRHWAIKNLAGKWMLVRWTTYPVFAMDNPVETYQEFPTEKEAIAVMVLEQFEQ